MNITEPYHQLVWYDEAGMHDAFIPGPDVNGATTLAIALREAKMRFILYRIFEGGNTLVLMRSGRRES